MSKKPDPNQLILDFSSQYHNRILQLSEVVGDMPGAKLAYKYFLHLVLRFEKPDAGLTWSTKMIAEEMLCDRRSVQRITSHLRDYGLLTISARFNSNDSDRPNEYRIDWQGVRRLLTLKYESRLSRLGVSSATAEPLPEFEAMEEERSDSGQQGENLLAVGATRSMPAEEVPPRHAAAPQRQFVTGGRQDVTPNKEQLTPDLTLSPKTAPVPELELELEPGPDESETKGKLPQMALEMQDLMQSPDLLAASRRLVRRLPDAATLADSHGPWRVLSVQHLNEPLTMIRWFRRQLALPFPVAKGTEAELVVVLAAAKWADELPPAEVRKSRVAAFSWIVKEGNWMKVRKYIPVAVKQLENLAAVKGRFWLEEGE